MGREKEEERASENGVDEIQAHRPRERQRRARETQKEGKEMRKESGKGMDRGEGERERGWRPREKGDGDPGDNPPERRTKTR